MKKRVAVDIYKKASLGRGHAKMKTVGTIINTTAEAVIEDDQDQEAA